MDPPRGEAVTAPTHQPPPDLTSYTDLRVFDRTDQEIIEAALVAVGLNLPDWVQREGHTEVLILEGLALELSEAITAVNRLPGAVLETLLQLFAVFKSYGSAPTALAQITVADTTGHTIPAGTRLYLPTIDGTGMVTMLVEPPGLTIAAGSSSGIVSLIGDVFTAAANGAPIGTVLQMASPMPFVDQVVLTTAVADGLDPETDEKWRDRGVQRLARLSDALVIPRHFEAAALEDPRVFRVIAVDNNDPATAGVGDDPGHITVAVLGDGAALSVAARAEIEAALEIKAIAILDVHVTDIVVVTVTVATTVTLADASDPAAVTDAVEQALIDYLDPMTWAYGSTVWRNELIALIDQVPGVDRVVTVSITGANSAGDYPLPTASTLPRGTAASITVSVG